MPQQTSGTSAREPVKSAFNRCAALRTRCKTAVQLYVRAGAFAKLSLRLLSMAPEIKRAVANARALEPKNKRAAVRHNSHAPRSCARTAVPELPVLQHTEQQS